MISSTPRPHSTPGKHPVPILQEAGWASGPVWTGGKSRPHRGLIPDPPGRSQSLYRLSYPQWIFQLSWMAWHYENHCILTILSTSAFPFPPNIFRSLFFKVNPVSSTLCIITGFSKSPHQFVIKPSMPRTTVQKEHTMQRDIKNLNVGTSDTKPQDAYQQNSTTNNR